jgi:hypothetical protein
MNPVSETPDVSQRVSRQLASAIELRDKSLVTMTRGPICGERQEKR